MFFMKSISPVKISPFFGDYEEVLTNFYRDVGSSYPIKVDEIHYLSDDIVLPNQEYIAIEYSDIKKMEFNQYAIRTLVQYIRFKNKAFEYLNDVCNVKKIIISHNDIKKIEKKLKLNVDLIKRKIWKESLNGNLIANRNQNVAEIGGQMILMYYQLLRMFQEAKINKNLMVIYYE